MELNSGNNPRPPGETIRLIRLWLIAAAMLIIPLLFDPFSLHPVTDPKNAGIFILAGLLLILHGWGLLAGEHFPRLRMPLVLGCLGVLILLALHVFYATRRAYAFDASFPYVGLLVIALSVALTVRTVRDARVLIASAALSAFLISVYGLLQQFGIEPLERLGLQWKDPIQVTSISSITSTLGNPHYVGVHLSVALFLLMAWVANPFGSKAGWLRLLMAVIIGLACLGVIYFTRARSAVLAVLCGIVYLWIFWPNRRWREIRQRGPVLVGILILIAAALVVLFPRFRNLAALKDQSFNSRLLLWQVSGEMWKASPWTGIGMDRFPAEFEGRFLSLMNDDRFSGYKRIADSLESLRSVYAHNEFVQYLTEFGILGFAVWMWFFLAGLQSGADVPGPSSPFMRQFLGASLAAVLGASLFSFPLHLPATALIFYLSAGLLMGRWDEPPALTRVPLFTLRKWYLFLPMGIILIGLGIVPVWYVVRTYPAYWYAGEAFRSVNSGNLNASKDLGMIDKALKRRPNDGEMRMIRGICLAYLNRFNESIREFNEAEKNFSSHTLYFYRGKVYSFANQRERAEADFRRVYALDPDFPEIHFWLGKILYYDQGRFPEAAAEFREELLRHPNHTDARALLGLSLFNQGDYAGAESALLSALDLDPKSLALREKLGDLYNEHLGNLPAALTQYGMAEIIASQGGQTQVLRRIREKINECNRLRDLQLGPEKPGPSPGTPQE